VDHELSEASGRLGINGLALRGLFEKFGAAAFVQIPFQDLALTFSRTDAVYDREDYCQIYADFMKCLNE
jgi:hypothetical protein